MCRITFRQETVKRLKEELERAYTRGDQQAVRRMSVLLMIGQRMSLDSILAVWNVSTQTVYNWLNEFVRGRWASLTVKKGPGRPAGLTKTQKRKLMAWIEAGPEACGYACGCWTSTMIQELIHRKFNVLYNRFYVCELLRNLGCSYQKARFVSDPLDGERISPDFAAGQRDGGRVVLQRRGQLCPVGIAVLHLGSPGTPTASADDWSAQRLQGLWCH